MTSGQKSGVSVSGGGKAASTLCLLMTAMIWGLAFVAQRTGMDSIGPFYFSALRMLLGTASLWVVVLISRYRHSGSKRPEVQTENDRKQYIKTLWKGGSVCGVIIFFASNLQQVGLVSVDAGKTGFITALYILLVPIFGIFLKHRTTLFNWVGALLGAIGLYFLCITAEFSVSTGDITVLAGAVFWALHILFVDHFAPRVNVVELTAVQFLIAGILTLAVAAARETITPEAVKAAGIAIAYTGIMSTAVAFSLQALGQKNANPTAAAIILSTEALFATLAGFIILGETLTGREFTGCVFMMSAVVISQLPSKPLRRKDNIDHDKK